MEGCGWIGLALGEPVLLPDLASGSTVVGGFVAGVVFAGGGAPLEGLMGRAAELLPS